MKCRANYHRYRHSTTLGADIHKIKGNICFIAIIRTVVALKRTDRAMADIHFVYKLIDSNAPAAQGHYLEQFPETVVSDSGYFLDVHHSF